MCIARVLLGCVVSKKMIQSCLALRVRPRDGEQGRGSSGSVQCYSPRSPTPMWRWLNPIQRLKNESRHQANSFQLHLPAIVRFHYIWEAALTVIVGAGLLISRVARGGGCFAKTVTAHCHRLGEHHKKKKKQSGSGVLTAKGAPAGVLFHTAAGSISTIC